MNISVGIIFKERPGSWGLRGDPYLWDDLEKHFLNVTTSFSEEDFCKEVYRLFEKFTGCKIDSKKYIHVLKYRHGGMSSGMVSPDFWLNKLIPILIDRLDKLNLQINWDL